MDPMTHAILKLLLLAVSLHYYNNQSNDQIQVEIERANVSGVYISNRYYQRVITSEDGLRTIEKIGTDNEKWIFNADGTIQNVGTGLFLRHYLILKMNIHGA